MRTDTSISARAPHSADARSVPSMLRQNLDQRNLTIVAPDGWLLSPDIRKLRVSTPKDARSGPHDLPVDGPRRSHV
jgi:hypothetical protein